MFGERSNDTRANDAQNAIDHYGSKPGLEADMADLLTDMMHLANRRYDEPFEKILDRARMNFEAEAD